MSPAPKNPQKQTAKPPPVKSPVSRAKTPVSKVNKKTVKETAKKAPKIEKTQNSK